MAHETQRALIDAHFAGRISSADELTMRLHYNVCEPCRRYYARHLLLAELDPTVLDARERIAGGLGLRSRPRFWRWVQAAMLAASAVLASVWLLLPSSPPPPEFQARGSLSGARAGLRIYRFEPGGSPALVGKSVSASDELGFAYRNPDGFRYLSICGVDERGHVYWYHPAWTDAALDPESVAIAAGSDFHELPEAITQDIGAGRLQIVALFAPRPLHVRELESQLAGRSAGDPALLKALESAYPDAALVSRELEIGR